MYSICGLAFECCEEGVVQYELPGCYTHDVLDQFSTQFMLCSGVWLLWLLLNAVQSLLLGA